MDECALSSSGPPCDAESSYMSTDGKLISKEHGNIIRGHTTKKRKKLASLSLTPKEEKMKAAMEQYTPEKKNQRKLPRRRRGSRRKNPPKVEKVETEEEKNCKIIC